MKLLFKKDKDGKISVKFRENTGVGTFSYSKMIKKLFDEKIVEDAEIEGDFSEIEKDSIKSLIEELRTALVDSATST